MGQAIKIVLLAALFALAAAAGPAAASSNLVQDGQFLSTSLSSPGGYVCNTVATTCTSALTDWSATCSVQGICGNGGTPLSLLFPGTGGVAFNGLIGLNVALPDSPDGGNMIADDGDPNYTAPLFQTIAGLTAGQTYDLTFWQAADQQSGDRAATTEQWAVSLGSDTQDSTLMNTPGGQFNPWNQQSLAFVATSTSELLNFLALGTPSGEPPVVLLADVSLTQVPEPVTLTLLGTGLVGLVAVRRRRAR
jgi:hypothetical protein